MSRRPQLFPEMCIRDRNKANRVLPDELGADEQRVRDAACNLLHLVGDVDAEAAEMCIRDRMLKT